MFLQRVFWAVVGVKLLGELASVLMPFQIGAYIDGVGLDEVSAGFTGAIETATLAICMILLAWFARGISPRKLAIFGVLFVIVGQFTTAFAGSYPLLIGTRMLAGVGAGFCISATLKTIASYFKEPEVAAGHSFAFLNIGVASLLWLAPSLMQISEWPPHVTLFILFGALALLILPIASVLPKWVNGEGHVAPDEEALSFSNLPWRPVALFALAQFFLLIGIGAVWAFLERIGLAIGIPLDEIGLYLGVTLLLSVSGSFLAGWLGSRFGRTLPLTGGCLAIAVASIGVGYAQGPESYVAAILAFQFAVSFTLPYLVGTAAVLDRVGSVAIAAYSIQVFSFGVGTALGGLVAHAYATQTVGWVGVFGCSVGALIFVPVCREINRIASNGVPIYANSI